MILASSNKMRIKITSTIDVVKSANYLDYEIAFTSGCFDLFHPGHVHFLFKCREVIPSCTLLVVGLNSDDSVWKWKQRKPIYDQDTRAYMLSLHPEVDFIVKFDERNPKRLINRLEPDILLHGHSEDRPAWTKESVAELESFKGEIIKLNIEGRWSTTDLIRQISASFRTLDNVTHI